MSDWVVYHNPDVTGRPPIDRAFAVSNRRAGVAADDTLWLIAGAGRSPRQYALFMRFTVVTVKPSPKGWGMVISGKDKRRPRHGALNHLSWFPLFRRQNGNFAFGLRQITDRGALAGLKRLIP